MKGRLPFAILKPVQRPRNEQDVHLCLGRDDLEECLEQADPNDYIALDIETNGTHVFRPQVTVVGFSLADSRGAGYWEARHWSTFLEWAHSRFAQLKFIGHNVFFDGAFAYRDAEGRHLNWAYCTLGLYKQLATEGWPGQRWGLKAAQRELLGWKDTNEEELNRWLVENGYRTASRANLESIKEKGDWFFVEETGMWAKADKGKMSKAPPSILGRYCALDALSTYEIFKYVLKPALDRFEVLREYHEGPFLNLVEILIEQELSGFKVDLPKLRKYHERLGVKAAKLMQDFLELPEISSSIAYYNEQIVGAHLLKEPPKYAKVKERKEPARYTKQGKINKQWLKWKEWKEAQAHVEPSKRWMQWEEKRQRLASENHFNINSSQQLAWLFYERLEYPILLTTETGNPAVDGKAMSQWGVPGKMLTEHSKLEKEASYVEAAIRYQAEGVIHPQFKVPGTLTGRLSGAGSFNVQQQPKTKEYLSLLKAREGHLWVDFDYTALEPCVLTELSRDPSLLKLYGPGAKKNDIYIFTGAYVKGIGDKFRAEGYDPENPTAEGIRGVKSRHKGLRQIMKVLVLSSQYGAGPRKIHETLQLQGVKLSLEEVQEIHRNYWQLYKGIKDYERFLMQCWHRNGGWVLNGIGRPLSISPDYTKDIVNRVVQSTGHDIHMVGLQLLRRILKERNVNYSWVIADFHDEAILEVPEGQEQLVVECFRAMERELNEVLKPFVPIRIDPAIGKNLADFKVEE